MRTLEKFISLPQLNDADHARRENQLALGEELSKHRPPANDEQSKDTLYYFP